jgi:pyruvate kinase
MPRGAPQTRPAGSASQHPTRAKIVATLGPASESPETVRKLIEAGVSVFRLNFSHGDLEQHGRRLGVVREVSERMGRPIAAFGDLGGPKIRIGTVPPIGPLGGLELEAGQDVLLCPGLAEACVRLDRAGAAVAALPVTYPNLVDEVRPGHRVLINDGAVRMLAVERSDDGSELRCRVTVGGVVSSGKGINLPDSDISAPAITARDWACVDWAAGAGLDFLALSFVRRASEVLALRDRLGGLCAGKGSAESGGMIPVIAKIEKPEAVENLAAIVDAADAIMVARGDLGVEMDIAQVPIVQRKVLAACQHYGKPCIVATQMLESMIEASGPTRAEASDVASAIFAGADAVMLSGETAIGKHPALVVETMRRIVGAAEAGMADLPASASPPGRLIETRYPTAALAHGAWHISRDIGARLVVCWSQSGGTARYLSQNDFRVPIVAYSSSTTATRRMALLRNVTPLRCAAPERLGDFTDIVERDMLARGWVRPGEPVVLLAGKPLGQVKATNSIAIFYIGDPVGGYRSHRS